MHRTEQPGKETIFNRAAEFDDPARRAAYLDKVCGDHAQLRSEIEKLLHHDADAGSFLGKPPAHLAATLRVLFRSQRTCSSPSSELEGLHQSDWESRSTKIASSLAVTR